MWDVATGEPVRQLLNNGFGVNRLVLNEAGGWIAYGARSPKDDWDLFLMRPDGSGVRNITNTPDATEGAPRFSPDGRHISYISDGGGADNVWVMDADGANRRAVTSETFRTLASRSAFRSRPAAEIVSTSVPSG